jgi:hypothetical protein
MAIVAKLVSGEFVVAQEENGFLINALLIRFNINQTTGDVNQQLIPYMAPVSNSLGRIISYDKVITTIPASDDLNKSYGETMENIIKAINTSKEMSNEKVGSTQGPIINENSKVTSKHIGDQHHDHDH